MTNLDRIGRRHWIAVAVIGALAFMAWLFGLGRFAWCG